MPERSAATAEAASKHLDAFRWVVKHAEPKLQAEFGRKTKILAEHSDAKGAEITFMALLRAGVSRDEEDYWDSVTFREFFEECYALKITTAGEAPQFENALKNRRKELRKAEARHLAERHRVVIDLVVSMKEESDGAEPANRLREKLESDPERELGQLLLDRFQTRSKTRMQPALPPGYGFLRD